MDPFTQRLMDRARVRRENLEKKLTDQNTPRKRPMPLGDHNEQVIDTTSSSQDDDDSDGPVMQDSPKRQCVRSTEQHIKADTPAIQGVHSRRDALANSRTFGVENVEDDYVPPLRRRHDALLDAPNTVPVPVAPSRRNRLAALASTINNWEDDLSQPRIKPPEEKKRGWQPPKAPESENKAESESKRNRFSKVDDGPSKPPRTYEYESSSRERSPEKAARSSPKKTVVSSLTVNIGGGSPKPAQIQVVAGSTTDVSPTVSKNIGFVPGTTTAVSPSVKTLGSSSSSTSSSNLNRSPKPFRRNDPTRGSGSPVRSVAAPKPVNARDESSKPASLMAAWKSKDKANSRRDSDVNEPTKQPVAARMGLWETKINEAEKLKKPVSPIKAGTGNAPKAPRPKSAVVMRQKTAAEPTDESVHNRMSLWEKRVVDSKKDTSPTRAPRPLSADIKAGITQKASEMQGRRTSPRKAPSSAVMSPEKVGPATKTLADRLAEMEQGWQRNEIAAKIKADKDKDMAMLQNRWKNGMPSEGTGETEAPNAQVSAPPPAPPAPPLLATPKSPAKDSPVSSKREVHRQKVRGESKSEENGSNKPASPANFENKLRAMGFDVHGSTDTGNVAVADLTPHKDRERDEKKNGNTPKKANIQLKVVEVEDSRTTSTTFGETKVSMKNAEGPGTHVSSVTTTLSTGSQPQTNKTSIYQLIKNKGAQPSTPLARPVSQPRQDDSFDSGDSYDEADESYSDQESEIYGSKPVHQGVRHAVSQQSVYSASSETSERTDYTETETEYTEDNSEDEDYTDEESEEDEEGDCKVDDLLDEVMDDTITTDSEPAPVPKPRQYAVQTDQRRQEPRSSRDDENFRVPRVQVPMRRKDNRVTFSDSVAGGSTSSQTATSSSAGSSSSSASESESDAERPVVYSIDMYRRSNSHRNDDSIPKMTIVRHSENTKRASAIEEPLPYIPEKPVRQRLQELQDMVNQEQSVVQQTSNALNQCCGANSNFANSIEAVECHRLLLIACKKREGYLTEMERLRSNRGAKSAGPSGSLSISDIRIPLKKDFTQKIGTLADVSQHFFVCLLRNGSNTIVSQMVSTHDAMVRDTLDIPNMFKISDIKQDFKTELEIYSMSINREQTISTPKKKQKAQTPKKGLFGSLKPSTPRSMQSPGGPMVVRTTNFSQIASLPITLRSVNKSHFSLDRVPYASPLQGTIHIRLQCIMESAVEEKGFLTMFEDVGGFGAWHRRWCVLKNNVLSYWKYPDDENIKEPMGYVDLKMCITERVGLIPRDICARPHTFELVCVRRQHKGDSNTLITRCNNTMTSTRHQLSADTKEDRLIWCDALNKALTNLRMWNTDALRPVKMQ